jgi:hypothetical protein
MNHDMKRFTLLTIFFFGFLYSSFAYDSGIALTTDKGMSMQVFVNGKLFNKEPGKYVRVRSTPGLFRIAVKVLNPRNKKWYSVHKEIRAQKGFELQYRVAFVNSKLELIEVKKYPIYSRYFLNPGLYNRHSVS